MSYHHLTSLPSTTRTLASLLNPGGKLLVADLYKDVNLDTNPSSSTSSTSSAPNSSHHPDEHHHSCPHPHQHSGHSHIRHSPLVPHTHGLTIPSLRAAFESAGLKEVDVRKRIRVRGNKKGAEEKEERYIVVAGGLKV
jgi:hypothetical protein